jgi:DNA ligase-associated metallophosphoesterase
MDAVEREIQGEIFAFLSEKAVHWPGRRTLMVADLHWGKAEIFQKAGIPVSSAILHEDLEKLKGLVDRLDIGRLILLGDLMHGKEGLTADVRDTVTRWRQSMACDILFIKGNHDRHLILPDAWGMQMVSEPYEDGPFLFSHHPETRAGSFTFCGHLHPVVHVGSRKERLRLPCFWIQASSCVLPSFGTFTGGAPIRPGRRDSILAIAEQSVFALQS